MALSKTTQDHDEIRQWAERRGALPAEVASTEKNGETGILRFEFPKAKNHNDAALKPIEWDEFFEKFDRNGLSLVYQEVTAEGAESNFNKLIYPEDASESAKKGSGRKSAAKTSGKSAGKKTPAKKTSGKGAAKKTAAKQSAAKKAPANKASAKNASAKNAPAKKAPAKKAPAKKTAAKKRR